MSTATDEWIGKILNAGDNPIKIKEYLDQRLKVKGPSTTVLESFKDVARYSAVWANELLRLSDELDSSIFLYYVDTFLTQCDLQRLNSYGSILSRLLCKFTDHVIEADRPLLGLSLLLRTLPDTNTITPMHAQLMLLSIKARKCSVGRKVLNREFLTLAKCATRDDLALFHYYGAEVYMAYNEFHPADDFLAIALEVASLCSVRPWMTKNGYSRRLLLSLISGTKVPKLPKYQHPEVGVSDDMTSRDCHPYLALALAVHSSDVKQFLQVAETHRETFDKDHNWPLVCEARLAFLRSQLRECQKAYSRVPLEDMAAATPRLLADYGRIDESNGAFVFETEVSQNPAYETYELLEKVSRMKVLMEKKSISVTKGAKFQKAINELPKGKRSPAIALNMGISDDDVI